MARRKKTSTADDLVDLVALLPWYVGVVLAAIGYAVLHHFAVSPLPAVTHPGQMGDAMVGVVGRGLATGGQYVVPLICLLGAAVSAWRRRARKLLVDGVTRSDTTDILHGVTWQEFEMLVGEGFRLQGFQVTENAGPGPDGGVDLTLRKNGEIYLVQCKQWRAFKVGVPVVRELYGALAAAGAAGGFVVTSGRFTPEAEAFASGRNLRLLDGPELHRLLKQARQGIAEKPAETSTARPASDSTMRRIETTTPACPRCAQPMVRRTAKKGAHAGQSFWGCSDFPKCRGTV